MTNQLKITVPEQKFFETNNIVMNVNRDGTHWWVEVYSHRFEVGDDAVALDLQQAYDKAVHGATKLVARALASGGDDNE